MKILRFSFILIYLHCLQKLANGQVDDDHISFVMLYDSEQQAIPYEISQVIREFEYGTMRNNYKISPSFVELKRKNLNETIDELCSIADDKGITAVIDVSLMESEIIYDFFQFYNIPIVPVDISIKPFLRIMESYLRARGGNDAALIFQNERYKNEALYYIVEESELRVASFGNLTNKNMDKLNRIRPIPSYYIIAAQTVEMERIIKYIYSRKLIVRPDAWALLFLDFKGHEYYSTNKYTNLNKIISKIDLNCNEDIENENCMSLGSSSILKILIKEVIIKMVDGILNGKLEKKQWNCEEDTFDTEASKNITETNFGYLWSMLNSSKILTRYQRYITISLIATIKQVNITTGNENEVAIWQRNSLYFKNESIKIQPTKKFFRIGIAEAIPWTYMRRDTKTGEFIFDKDGKPIWEGYCIDFVTELSKQMNFDYELIAPRKGKFGKRNAHGRWDGLVGDLVSGEIDIAIAALKMTSDREEVIDFVAPYYEQTGISIVIRKPVRQTSLFKFMTVLRLEVWLSILGSLVLTAVLIWFLDKYSPYSAKNNKDAYPYPCRDFTLKESFWFALTSFTPQGGGEVPKSLSGRTIVAAYWLFVVLMLATFTANLAAFLTVERMQTPVQSLDQLARQSRINYTVVENSDVHKHFINMKHAEDTLFRMWKELTLNETSDYAKYRIWDYPIKEQYGHILQAINSSNPVRNAEDGFRKVNDHINADFAFIHDYAEIKYELSKNCNLTEVGEVFAEQPYAVAVQQGSQLQDQITYAILEMQKDRFFEGLSAKFWNNSIKGDCSHTDDNEGITLQSLGGVFIATLFGLALAIITLIFEVIYYRKKNSTVLKVAPRPETNHHEEMIKTIMQSANSETSPATIEKKLFFRGKEIPDQITFGNEFKSVAEQQKNISYLPIYKRAPIHNDTSYYE